MRALCLIALAASCAPPAPAGPREPELWPALGSIKFFVGRWNARVETENNSITAIRWSVKPAVGGRWLAGRARATPADIEARDFWTVEPSGAVVRIYVDSAGTFGQLRAVGWRGDTLTFEGTLSSEGTRLEVRETIRRLARDRFRAEWQMQREGKWVTTSVELLVRSP